MEMLSLRIYKYNKYPPIKNMNGNKKYKWTYESMRKAVCTPPPKKVLQDMGNVD